MALFDTKIDSMTEKAQRLSDKDPQVRAAWPDEHVYDAISDAQLPLGKIFEIICNSYADRPIFGTRDRVVVPAENIADTVIKFLPTFTTITFAQAWKKILGLAATWHNLGIKPGDFIASLGFTSAEYAMIDMAAAYLGLPIVPLQTSSSAQQIQAILNEVNPTVVMVSAEYISDGLAATREFIVENPTAAVKFFQIFDYFPDDPRQVHAMHAAQQELSSIAPQISFGEFHQLVAEGENFPTPPYFVNNSDTDPIARLIYTSGSTGAPKGAIYTLSHTRKLWQNIINLPHIILHYMPFSHLYGMFWLYDGISSGGTGYFTSSSDNSTLFEDIHLVRPTMLNLVPRVCDMLYQQYHNALNEARKSQPNEPDLDERTKITFRNDTLGGRIFIGITGSAPISQEMHAFIISLLATEVFDGYGSTEAGMIFTDGEINDSAVLEYKLVDVPELGYFTSDQPYPRGELYVKTTTLIPGYYKRPELNSTIFDADGFYKTGDVMAEIAPKRYAYVDRSSNVIKLSQGEFVALSKIEAAFSTCPEIKQLFIYGNSSEPFLLAVIVPNDSLIERLRAGESAAAIKSSILKSMQAVAKENHLQGYEIPRDIILETEPFSRENGLLSGVGKLLRPALKKHYAEKLNEIYSAISQAQSEKLHSLKDTIDNIPTIDIVSRAVNITLGSTSDSIDPSANFADLGGDSLSAFTLSQTLTDIFHVEVPVRIIIGPTASLQHIADFIDRELTHQDRRPTVASIHGKDVDAFYANDLTLDKFIDPATLQAAHHLLPLAPIPHTVLLTGANGYLGRFLALNWLEKLAPSNGKLICIGRGSSPENAKNRIIDTLASDPELTEHFAKLAQDHLEVLVGDLGEVKLGLSDTQWDQLASSVDHIIHNGALVNHVLPYNQLFGPNTVGTAEIIRLALTTKLKSLSFMSTIAVAASGDSSVIDESSDIRVVNTHRSAAESYAAGYATSKWASEVLLREANEHYGVPVTVFRSDMILAHENYKGQLNPTDMFTRLIFSIVATSLAPESFYTPDASGQRARAHYEGLPVNFTAETVTTLGGNLRDGYHTFNLINTHQDGISLDTIVDWLIESGIPITKISDYSEWVQRFTAALQHLPEQQKHASLLPLMHGFATAQPPIDGSLIPAENLRKAVQDAGIGKDKDVPHITKELIHKYIADLHTLNFFA